MTDICQVPFSTSSLYCINGRNIERAREYISQYRLELRNRAHEQSRDRFRKNLKIDFRRVITKGNYEEGLHGSDEADSVGLLQRRKIRG